MDEDGCLFLLVLWLSYVLGVCIAVAVSWEATHSLLWAVLDGAASWLYLVYHFFISTL
jgi:hypothetical protein